MAIRLVETDEGGWERVLRAVPVDEIEDAPAVDAAPVVHSYWEPYGRTSNGTVGRWRCMNCKRTSLESGNFCPNCGARMDKEADNAQE